MPLYIIKLKKYYLEWSSVVDAPITYGMTLAEFKKYYKKKYGSNSMTNLEERLKRVEKNGTSCQLGDTIKDFISTNRAGNRGGKLSEKDLIENYCLSKNAPV